MPQSPQFRFIDTVTGLRDLAAELLREPVVACDLEADSLHHYREQVCLIQFSTPRDNYLVDPLAIGDLSPLAPLFASPEIRKVFHGADYDVRSLHRDFGMEIVNLFDTMIACQFLGEKEWGLAAALKKRFGVELDKQFQTADWSRRPIDQAMQRYAALDTAHLIPFYLQTVYELERRDRLEWVAEECRLLTAVRAAERTDAPLFLRCKGASRLPPRNLAVLEMLLQSREQEAMRRDRPPFKVIGSDILIALAAAVPLDRGALDEMTAIPDRLRERNAEWLLKSVREGLALPEEELPSFPQKPRVKRSPSEERCLKRLKEWRGATAADLAIDPGVLISNAQLEGLCAVPRGKGLPSGILKDWQLRHFGDGLLGAIAGR